MLVSEIKGNIFHFEPFFIMEFDSMLKMFVMKIKSYFFIHVKPIFGFSLFKDNGISKVKLNAIKSLKILRVVFQKL